MKTQNDNNELRNKNTMNSKKESFADSNKKSHYQTNNPNKTPITSATLFLLKYNLIHHQSPSSRSARIYQIDIFIRKPL